MGLGDILKGTLKVAGSAGLILAAGVAKTVASVAEEGGKDSGSYDELSDICMNELNKMWAGDDYEEPSAEDENKRKVEILDNRIKRLEKLISKTKSMARDAGRYGDTESYDEYLRKIDEYRDTIDSIKDEKQQLIDEQMNNSEDQSDSDND